MSNQATLGAPPGLYEEDYSVIVDSLLRGEIGFLLGAGVSVESKTRLDGEETTVPDGSYLAVRMLRRCVLGVKHENDKSRPDLDALAAKYPFEAISAWLKEKLPRKGIEQWMDEFAGLGAAEISTAHIKLRELHGLLPSVFPKVIFTTNFDTLIEKTFQGDEGKTEARCITYADIAALPEARRNKQIAVVHLHGSISQPGSIVCGEQNQATVEGPIFDLLRASLATDIFVMVGYSLTDMDLRGIFFNVQRIADTRERLSKRTFAVSRASGHPGESDTEAGVAREIWKKRNVDHIAATASEFFTHVFEVAEDALKVRIRAEVAAALDTEPAVLDNMLKSAAERFRLIEPYDLLIYLYYTLTPLDRKKAVERKK